MQCGRVKLLANEKSFHSKEKYQTEGLYEPPEQVSLKLTAQNQTLKLFLGVANKDLSFQPPIISKKCLIKRPN